MSCHSYYLDGSSYITLNDPLINISPQTPDHSSSFRLSFSLYPIYPLNKNSHLKPIGILSHKHIQKNKNVKEKENPHITRSFNIEISPGRHELKVSIAASSINSILTLRSESTLASHVWTNISILFSYSDKQLALHINNLPISYLVLPKEACPLFSSTFPVFIGGCPYDEQYNSYQGLIHSIILDNNASISKFPLYPSLPTSLSFSPVPTRMYPFHRLSQLLYWQSNDPLNICNIPIRNRGQTTSPYLIHCHDMKGGYSQDSHVQGESLFHAYNFTYYSYVDICIYFSHSRISPPPVNYTTAAHKEGVRVLGTVICEWEEGKQDVLDLISPYHRKIYIEQLVRMSHYYNFDGWFINIESDIPPSSISDMCIFLQELTISMHSSKNNSLVLWYDSINSETGKINWQSELNEKNECFFQSCDGIFTDYHWKPEQLAASIQKSNSHHTIVGSDSNSLVVNDNKDIIRSPTLFTGIDIFGRGTYGGGHFNTYQAMAEIVQHEGDIALFAPGWSYEGTNHYKEFEDRENKLWKGINWIEVEIPFGKLTVNHKLNQIFSKWVVIEQSNKDNEKNNSNSSGDFNLHFDSSINKNVLITSYSWCRRKQKIHISQHIDSPTVVINDCPDICISQSYKGTGPNFNDKYYIKVSLFSATQSLISQYEKAFTCNDKWTIMTYTFSNYSVPVEYLEWEDGGKDAEGWAGHYGAQLGDINIKIKGKNVGCIGDYIRPRLFSLKSLLPLLHYFNTGKGRHYFIEGEKQFVYSDESYHRNNTISATEWFNMNEQDIQSILADNVRYDNHLTNQGWYTQMNYNYDIAYMGGSSIEIKTVYNGSIDKIISTDFEFPLFNFHSSNATSSLIISTTIFIPMSNSIANIFIRLRLITSRGEVIDLDNSNIIKDCALQPDVASDRDQWKHYSYLFNPIKYDLNEPIIKEIHLVANVSSHSNMSSPLPLSSLSCTAYLGQLLIQEVTESTIGRTQIAQLFARSVWIKPRTYNIYVTWLTNSLSKSVSLSAAARANLTDENDNVSSNLIGIRSVDLQLNNKYVGSISHRNQFVIENTNYESLFGLTADENEEEQEKEKEKEVIDSTSLNKDKLISNVGEIRVRCRWEDGEIQNWQKGSICRID